MTMAELLAQRAALLALPVGVENVQFNDRIVGLIAPQEDRDNKLAAIDRQIAALEGKAGATYHFAVTDQGLLTWRRPPTGSTGSRVSSPRCGRCAACGRGP